MLLESLTIYDLFFGSNYTFHFTQTWDSSQVGLFYSLNNEHISCKQLKKQYFELTSD